MRAAWNRGSWRGRASGSAHRRRPRAGLLALAGLALAAAGAAALPDVSLAKEAPRLIRSHSTPVITCVPAPAPTARARVRLAMTVVNYDNWSDWADHMEVKVRLESTAAGHNLHGNWRASKTPYLTTNRRHRFAFDVLTDNKSGNASWKVHIKLIWHRPAPVRNIVKNIYKPFAPSCANVTGGGSPSSPGGIALPAAPAVPSPNG